MKLAIAGSIVNDMSASLIPVESGFGDEKHGKSGLLISFSDTCPKQTRGNRIEIKKMKAGFLPDLNVIIG